MAEVKPKANTSFAEKKTAVEKRAGKRFLKRRNESEEEFKLKISRIYENLIHPKRLALEEKLGRLLDWNMPMPHIEDLHANQFHGPDNPHWYETVENGRTIAKWKAKKGGRQ